MANVISYKVKLTTPEGDSEGDILDGMRHGRGYLTEGGVKYEVEYREDREISRKRID